MSAISAYTALGQYLIGKEKSDRENTKLKDAAVSGSVEKFTTLVSRGYNPYRRDKDGKMAFEWAENQEKFKELSSEWIHQLAFDMNPDTFSEDDEDDEDQKKTLEKVTQYVGQADGHELAMLREHLSSMLADDEEEEEEKAHVEEAVEKPILEELKEKKTELERLEFIHQNPPYEVVILDHEFIITDPLGEHDFTINYSGGGKSTLEGATVKEVFEAVKANEDDKAIMFEIFLMSAKEHTGESVYPKDEDYTVVFPHDRLYPEFEGMVWSLEKIEDKDQDPSWEMHGYYFIKE